MIYENEVIMCILSLGVLTFMLAHHGQLKRVPAYGYLLTGFCVLVAAWLLTILEHFLWTSVLNFLEHFCYAFSSVVVALWCRRVFGRVKEQKRCIR